MGFTMTRRTRTGASWLVTGALVALLLSPLARVVAASKKSLQDLDYRVFPRRTAQEAAVLEWGNSAILTALDVSVAHFGPQTSDAALLEVETQPILAEPLDGVGMDGSDDDESSDTPRIQPLDNADEMLGNMCIMTNTGGLTGVQMAKVAQASGAAALLVVNSDAERQDDIYRLPIEEGHEDVDIPVVMISLNSANMLATAMLENDNQLQQDRLTNRYMPDRVRLYAGDDRPFFEDVEAAHPTVYLIHDLLKPEECDALIERAKPVLRTVARNDHLQYTTDADKLHHVERVTLWQGLLQTPARKAVEERIEQVTAFPSAHYSDFVVDRLSVKQASHYKPRYDTFNGRVPVASMTIFLSDAKEGGELVYPSAGSAAGSDPLQIQPRKGMVVVHHNTDERGNFEMASLHSLLPPVQVEGNDDGFYVAHKYIFMDPLSNGQRVALPVFAAPFGGKLPDGLVRLYELLVEQFGKQQGTLYFEKVCIFVPMLLVLMMVQVVVDFVRKQIAAATKTTSSRAKKSSSKGDSSTSTTKKKRRTKKDQ